MNRPEWYVFRHDFNKQKIVTFNIFDHVSFNNAVAKSLTNIDSKDKFADDLKKYLSYYFRNRSEYEIIISPWIGGQNTENIKVDIYTQIMNNWDAFLEYVWTHW